MPVKPYRVSPFVKLVLLAWGMNLTLHGCALEFVVNGADQRTQSLFITLAYYSLFVGAGVGWWATRTGAVLLAAAALGAAAVLVSTRSFGAGFSFSDSFFVTVLTGPALGSIVLAILSIYERRKDSSAVRPTSER